MILKGELVNTIEKKKLNDYLWESQIKKLENYFERMLDEND